MGQGCVSASGPIFNTIRGVLASLLDICLVLCTSSGHLSNDVGLA